MYADTTKEFVSMLGLQKGQKVLDVGCGIGGGDFYMAEEFEVDVYGIDLSINMVSNLKKPNVPQIVFVWHCAGMMPQW